MPRQTKDNHGAWFGAVRVRAFLLVIGIPLAAAGIIALSPAWATLPVVGVAVAAVMTSLSKVTQRLSDRTCFTCGADLSKQPHSPHGIVCPSCGSLFQQAPFDPPSPESALAEAVDEGDEDRAARA